MLAIYQVDSFTDTLFKGNPAAVVFLHHWLTDAQMQAIAAENNVSETAFVIPLRHGEYAIRWFSPLVEVDFCGHATLAAAWVVFSQAPALTSIRFHTESVGELEVDRGSDGWLAMSFPQRAPEAIDGVPDALLRGLSLPPITVMRSPQAYFAIYASEQDVRELRTDDAQLSQLAPYDVVATAPGDGEPFDFVSRYFWPANGGSEDPVTGSIHAGLVPYWGQRLGKSKLHALQASARGGILRCQLLDDRVLVCGQAALYMQGTIAIP